MRAGLVTLALAVPLVLMACGPASSDDGGGDGDAGGPAGTPVGPGEVFTLAPGGSARLADGALTVTFKDVAGDSRCPTGAQCIWEGDATVAVSVAEGGGAPAAHELHTTLQPGEVAVGGYTLRLVALNPYPEQGDPIGAGDYRADFTLTPN
ncbi:hypothetical protein [Actinomadura hibisca]|uniref:hypothetical protein n=1 Tax=Actinomadura hibisca TaxID=68565 RepID=UPI00082B6B4D|nr:hypothetical protein [Actinomadura hibisca]